MAESPPSEADLLDRAEQALAASGEAGVATAWWERTLLAGPGAAHAQVDARVEVAAVAEEDLPVPAVGRPHAGYDPLLARLDPEALGAPGGAWRAGAAKTAIVTSRGGRAFEQRSFASVTLGPLSWAAVTPAGIDVAALGIEAAALDAGEATPTDPPDDDLPVVLGADAVAGLLDRLRSALAAGDALAPRLGLRVAASAVSLSDSPRFATTLPRSYDALGSPRRPVPLVQDGVAHRLVSRATGHATDASGGGARAEHLVLVGGGAAGVEELTASVERGIYLPTLTAGFLVEGGRRGPAIDVGALVLDPLAVLASVQALTSAQRTFAVGGIPRIVGATVCPALRAGGGVRFSGAARA